MMYYEPSHYDHLYLNHSYCNVYGTSYQLRYVYHNNDSGIVVEYIRAPRISLNLGVLHKLKAWRTEMVELNAKKNVDLFNHVVLPSLFFMHVHNCNEQTNHYWSHRKIGIYSTQGDQLNII
jgi:hypothetical protein